MKICQRPNYLLKLTLRSDDISDPQIYRTISCLSYSTFEAFHEAQHIASNWALTHTFDFKVKDPVEVARIADEEDDDTQEQFLLKMIQSLKANGTPDPQERYLLRIIGDDPHSPGGFSSGKGVDFMHNSARQHPQTPEKNASKVKLWEELDRCHYKDMPLEYEYDFGDRWFHEIKVIGRSDVTGFFQCIDGEGHSVAEDEGCAGGWEKLKAAYPAARPDKEQKSKMRWYETQASIGDREGLGNGREKRWAKGDINRKSAELAGRATNFT
ncbi:MAG: hypothetical protein Q9192_007683 [Flavoplaca navasiana]